MLNQSDRQSLIEASFAERSERRTGRTNGLIANIGSEIKKPGRKSTRPIKSINLTQV